jgi:dihydrofolate reductase
MIKAILATDAQFGISKDGVLPWPKNSEDLKFFREMTTGHTVVMGRLTWESPDMPSPLPNRQNVVVTNNADYVAEGAEVIVGDPTARLLELAKTETVFVIGGASLFESLLPIIDEIYITQINGNFDCDTSINNNFRKGFQLVEWRVLGNGTHVDCYRRRPS